MASDLIFFWKHKTTQDNQWHPIPGRGTPQIAPNGPAWFRRTDIEAMVVDTAPMVVGVGSVTHLRQLPHFDFTAHWSVFKNVLTMTAMHRTVLVLGPTILASQALDLDYRYAIPRWAHDRERRREEDYVRTQISYGMLAGTALYALRIFVFQAGTRYWAPLDVIMGGALADLMDREYRKAHGF